MNRLACLLAAALSFCMLGCPPHGHETIEADSAPVGPPAPAVLDLLEKYASSYDPAAKMLALPHRSPGYHSGIAAGELVHPTRESLIYALALLERNDSGDAERAAQIIARVLSLQDANSHSETCGVWPWVLEEPLVEMPAPDLNWAEFCGVHLAHILLEHEHQLPDNLRYDMQQSLERACGAIRRRDVGLSYTNIAILGGEVCALAGEILEDPELLAYGRDRLAAIAELTATTGSFSEYNSPPYTCLALVECERTLQLSHDAGTREAAEALRQMVWQVIAESFHPATNQWAGPLARGHNRLRASTCAFLSRRTGATIAPHATAQVQGYLHWMAAVEPMACPSQWLDRFTPTPGPPREVVRTFMQANSQAEALVGVTWLSEQVCLGTVSEEILWTQRRPVLGYWRGEQEPAYVLRLRFLHDGEDFASIGVRNVQQGPRALSVCHAETKRGSWHPSLDRPEGGVFHASRLELRYELRGRGAWAEDLGDGRFALIGDPCRVVIHTLPGTFAGRPIRWQVGGTLEENRSAEKEEIAFLSAICYVGEPQAFDFSQPLEMQLAAGIELLPQKQAAAEVSPQWVEAAAENPTAEWVFSTGQPLRATARRPSD